MKAVKKKKVPKPKPKVLIVRIEMSEADYAEARQIYTREEMVDAIRVEGLVCLKNLVRRFLAEIERGDLVL